MGNFMSSCYTGQANLQTAKLVDANANLRKIKLPMTVAELMLEEPGHVISPLDDIKRTQRVSAMKADSELLAGKVYLLVPVGRANFKVSELDMAIIECACKKRTMKQRGSSKVLPAEYEDKRDCPVRIEGDGESDTGFTCNRFRNYRQWNPVLEPIPEAC